MAIETKEQQYLRQIATALESIAKEHKDKDELTKSDSANENLFASIESIRQFCENHKDCQGCPLLNFKHDCLIGNDLPLNWRV